MYFEIKNSWKLQTTPEVTTIMNSKLKGKEVKEEARGHTSTKCWNEDLNTGNLTPSLLTFSLSHF